jgi:hypothetical protein
MRSFIKFAMAVAALAVGATSAAAQQAAAPQADPFKFTSATAAVFQTIKPEKAADFEAVWGEIRKGLAASSKPELQKQASSFKLLKSEPAAGQPIIYLIYVEQVPAGSTFDPVKLLYESGAFERAKADELYGKIKDAYTALAAWPMTVIGG